jgi:hypothetical protein
MANEQQDLEKLRSIVLEPRFTELVNRINRLEDGLKQVQASSGAAAGVKKDLDTFRADLEEVKITLGGVRSDVHGQRKDLDEVKNVMVGFNKKLTGAFSAFANPKA